MFFDALLDKGIAVHYYGAHVFICPDYDEAIMVPKMLFDTLFNVVFTEHDYRSHVLICPDDDEFFCFWRRGGEQCFAGMRCWVSSIC